MSLRIKVTKKTIYSYICIILTGVFCLVGITMTFIPRTENAHAASEASCLQSSSWPNVSSVAHACDRCFDNITGQASRSGQGALWITDNNRGNTAADSNSDVVQLTTQEVRNGKAKVRIYGAWYTCAGANTRLTPKWAYYVWFSEPGNFKWDGEGNPPAVDYLPYTPNMMLYRGYFTGSTFTWNIHDVFGAGQAYHLLDLDVDKFIAGAQDKGIDADGYHVYERSVSVNRCASQTCSSAQINRCTSGRPRYYNDTGLANKGSCFGDVSTITLKVPPLVNNEDDFSSTSTVRVPEQEHEVVVTRDDGSTTTRRIQIPTQTDTSDPDGTESGDEENGTGKKRGYVTVYTSSDTVDLKFWHNVFYDDQLKSGQEFALYRPPEAYNELCTNWTTATGGSGSGWGRSCVGQQESGARAGDEISYTVTDLEPGETVEVCSTITYNPKTYSVEPVILNGYPTGNTRLVGDGEGGSVACAQIIRSKVSGEASFWSTSTVTIPQSGSLGQTATDVNEYTLTSGKRNTDAATIRFSTDSDSVLAQYTHRMYYSDKLYKYDAYEGEDCNYYNTDYCNVKPADTFPSVCANYTIESTFYGAGSGGVNVEAEGQYCAGVNGDTNNHGEGIVGTGKNPHIFGGDGSFSSTIPSSGEPVGVNEQISYTPVYVVLGRRHVTHEEEVPCDPMPDDDPTCTETVEYFDNFDYYRQDVVEGGTGFTYAAAYASRLPEPTGNVGSTSGSIIYAGQTAGDLSWNTSAKSQAVRRLKAYEAGVYTIRDNVTRADASSSIHGNISNNNPLEFFQARYNDSIEDGDIDLGNNKDLDISLTPALCRYVNNSPYRLRTQYNEGISPNVAKCSMFKDAGGTTGAFDLDLSDGDSLNASSEKLNYDNLTLDYYNTIDSISEDETFNVKDHSTNYSSPFVVPDDIGYKYCNTYAYMYEHWVAFVKNNTDGWVGEEDESIEWLHDVSAEPSKGNNVHDYWKVYDSACRTIAKKPSTAIWNGSFMTVGGVKTSTATRYDDASSYWAQPITPSYSGDRTYGSWVEYLATVGGEVDGDKFSSGSGYGSGFISGGISNLTIASTSSPVGRSGIGTNSTQMLRLDKHFENFCDKHKDDETCSNNLPAVGGDGKIHISGTKIYNISGNLTINHDIVVKNGPFTNIYQLPRTIIFVDGNLNIDSEVEQIDAWLIVNGKIDTCSGYTIDSLTAQTDSHSDVCQKQLVFNGPVRAKQIALKRTFGADGTDPNGHKEPAEIFNYRADDYLWAYAQAGRLSSSYVEASSRELAPRY